MKSHSMKSPAGLLLAIFTLLTLLMLATRTDHFPVFNQLPTASIAVFFLAGIYFRRVKVFWFFYLLSIAIDLSSSYFRGQLSSCLTASYPMLVFSYAVMFGAGCLARPNWSRQSLIWLLSTRLRWHRLLPQ